MRPPEQLRRQPADNLFSDFVHAEIEGRRLNDRELCTIVQQLLMAGNETTTSTLGSALVFLIETPRLADTLHESTDLIRAFIEEVFRQSSRERCPSS